MIVSAGRLVDFPWMWLWPVLILVGLLVLGYVAVAVGRRRSGGSDVGPGSSARRILDERYARGEIDDEEYRNRKAELQ